MSHTAMISVGCWLRKYNYKLHNNNSPIVNWEALLPSKAIEMQIQASDLVFQFTLHLYLTLTQMHCTVK